MLPEHVSQTDTELGELQDHPTRKDDAAWLTSLANKWRSNREADLALRYETGAQLNAHYGNPGDPRKRKLAVLERASSALGISSSELSRMRRFAHSFKTFEEFRAKHPSVTTWTEVKALIPKLDANGETHSTAVEASVLQGLKRSMKHLSTNLQKVREGLSAAEKEDFLNAFRELALAVEDSLKVSVMVGQVREGHAPALSESKECEAGTALRDSA